MGREEWRLCTAQEHSNGMGFTAGDIYLEKPYTPMVVIDEDLSVEECNKLRMQLGCIPALALSWGKPFFEGEQKLEPLDLDPFSSTYGQTLRDNALVRVDDFRPGLEKCTEECMAEFPFKRESIPRVELEDTELPKAK